MNNKLFCFLFLAFLIGEVSAQVTTTPDSVQTKKASVLDTVIYSKRPFEPLAPSKAAFYSAIVPGLGQAYNHSYWKIPLVYGGLATAGYFYVTNQKSYKEYRDIFKRRKAGYINDKYYDLNGDGVGPDVTLASLENGQDYYQKNRDLSLLIFIGIYALNIIDANVDAHLKQFNINKDLSLKPFMEQSDFNWKPDVGLSLNLQF